jgi:hypothetical protein
MLRAQRLSAITAVVAASALALAAAPGARPQAQAAQVQPQAQTAQVQPQAQTAQVQPQAKDAPPGVDLPSLGVSLDRIRKLLRETPPTKPSGVSSLLRLEYHVEVVGKEPRVDFFKDFNIGKVTAVQYGGMTHAEFMRVTAPFWHRWQ